LIPDCDDTDIVMLCLSLARIYTTQS